jgi:crotonobetaine/carnitine-CoA ligase
MSSYLDDPRNWTLPALLQERVQTHGDQTLVTTALGDGSLTYGEADVLSAKLAAGLAGLGVKRGDRAVMMMGNRIEFVLTWFALNRLGACHAPINLEYRGDFLEHLVNTAEATVMVCEERYVEAIVASQERVPRLEHLIVVGDASDTGRFTPHAFDDVLVDADPPRVEVTPADLYAVMFTSGSTGRSKGALLPQGHARLLNASNAELLGLGPGAVYSSDLPLFHINAHMTVYGSMLAGATARLEERFSASRWLQRIRAANATHTSMLGVMVDFVLRTDPQPDDADNPLTSAWMVPCSPLLSGRFRDRFDVGRISTSYGTSECGMVARRVVDRSEDLSSGPVLTEHYEVEVVDGEDYPVATGQTGEIVVRPRHRWTTTLGYFGMPERTVDSFANLWFHTGDVGRIDEQGRLTFVDRVADRLRRRGENVASADVEHVLSQHEVVYEAAVVAVSADEEGGEDEIKACLVLAEGAELDPDEFWAWCDTRLPYFAVPRYLEVLQALPKTPTEKVIKARLREPRQDAAIHDRGVVGRVRS